MEGREWKEEIEKAEWRVKEKEKDNEARWRKRALTEGKAKRKRRKSSSEWERANPWQLKATKEAQKGGPKNGLYNTLKTFASSAISKIRRALHSTLPNEASAGEPASPVKLKCKAQKLYTGAPSLPKRLTWVNQQSKGLRNINNLIMLKRNWKERKKREILREAGSHKWWIRCFRHSTILQSMT